MAQEDIFLGTVANDKTGTALRAAGAAINRMFREVYATIAAVQSGGGGVSLSNDLPSDLGGVASAGNSTQAARANHTHRRPTVAEIGAAAVTHTHTIADVATLEGRLAGLVSQGVVGVANGVAMLNGAGRLVDAQVPTNVVTTTYKPPIQTFAAAYTAVSGDQGAIKRCTATADVVVTLPSMAASTVLHFQQGAAGKMQFAAGAGVAIESLDGALRSAGPGANVIATAVSTTVWNIDGGLVV